MASTGKCTNATGMYEKDIESIDLLWEAFPCSKKLAPAVVPVIIHSLQGAVLKNIIKEPCFCEFLKMTKQEKPLSTLWGCELSTSHNEETFKTDDTIHQHQLALRTMCLGAGAKEEFNIVELMTGEPGSGKGVPVATLHAKAMPTVNLSGIDLHPPVTFRLKSGAGPVYVCGEHVALEDEFSGMESGEEELEVLQARERNQRKRMNLRQMMRTTLQKREREEAEVEESDLRCCTSDWPAAVLNGQCSKNEVFFLHWSILTWVKLFRQRLFILYSAL
ncbi:hypothetical protein UPYG_G00279080 [Umbra pygmaea]|uniref:Nucleoplasmin core domain-containing protein n=1 Tax=Umbra pygmaea TaxID=75934 RepID=A0ABD0WKQ2_UMBPY